MKNSKNTTTSSLLEMNNTVQLQIKDNQLRDLLKNHHLLGTGENTVVFPQLKIKEIVEAAGHSQQLHA
jgi:hypothetical protein